MEYETERTIIFKYNVWNIYNQDNLYTYLIDLDNLQQQSTLSLNFESKIRSDFSSLGKHFLEKHVYVHIIQKELLERADGKLLKIVEDFKFNNLRTINVKYYAIDNTNKKLVYLEHQKDNNADIVEYKGKKYKIYKDAIEVLQ